MRYVCFYFQVHQPMRIRNYHFFEIGKNHDYFDCDKNSYIMNRISKKCYLPTNEILSSLMDNYPDKIKIAMSFSGIAIEQMQLYAPKALLSFQNMIKKGSVEVLAETYSHSLSSLFSELNFKQDIKQHLSKIKDIFGKSPKVFRNTELIYSDEIGDMVSKLKFKGMLTEGARHILGWRSPNFLYLSNSSPKLKLLLKNYRLSDDIAFRFSDKSWSDWPLTPDKYLKWLDSQSQESEIINIFIDYETFGEHQWKNTGIFKFLKEIIILLVNNPNYALITPSEAIDKLNPIGNIRVPNPISWADEERDISAWLGNELQKEAFKKLYSLAGKVRRSDKQNIKEKFSYLTSSDHLYYMSTKWKTDGDVHTYFNPFDSPYTAYINYMNVLSDLELSLKKNK